LLTWALMAIGWQRLSARVVALPWWSVLSAALMVALQERFQVAGEWLVGGFEAKGIAYALVFFGLDAAFARRWRSVWLWLGAASAWHVLVGGWAVMAMFFAWALERRRGAAPSFLSMLPALIVGGLLALPALIPALELTQGADSEVVAEANRIYVFERLPHHLNPGAFPVRGVLLFGGLLLSAGVLSRAARATSATRIAWRFALASAALWLGGWLIATLLGADPARAAGLLKFYWFRLADVAIPVAASLLAVAYLQRALQSSPSWGRAWLTAALLFAAFHLVDFGVQTQTLAYPRADRPGKVANYPAWRETCEWIAANTPTESRFITPRQNQTFKWYADRAEVVTWKDVPQDAKAIVAWRRLLDKVYRNASDHWYDGLAERSWSELQQLGKDVKAEYLILDDDAVEAIFSGPKADSHIVVDPVYRDTSGIYSVYKLTENEPDGN
jgi:hypothetical protein